MRGRHPQTLALNAEHIEVLMRNLRTGTTEHRVARRSQILLYRGEGLRPVEVAERLRCGRNTVWRTEQRYRAEGLSALEDRPRPGRPARISPPAAGADGSFSLS